MDDIDKSKIDNYNKLLDVSKVHLLVHTEDESEKQVLLRTLEELRSDLNKFFRIKSIIDEN